MPRRQVEKSFLELYARATVDFAASQSEKVIAVGHSMTGISNQQAAEYVPEQFEALVFLAAFLVGNGQCLLDFTQPGSIPKYYIECLQDRAITLDIKKMMHTENSCEKVFTMDTSHSPFYSQPEKVAQYLSSI